MESVSGEGSHSSTAPKTLEFFVGSGEVASLMRAFDWSQTSLGLPELWPQSLKTAVRILLTSRFSMWLGWGKDLVFFYNDAYRHDTLGIKHPWAMGRPTSEVWAEVWSDLKPRIDAVLQDGLSTWDEALLLYLERSGFSEETYHTFSYSPLADDDGNVSGVFCVVTEETARVIGERRLELLRDLGDRVAIATTEPNVLEAVRYCLTARPQDIPFSLIYLVDPSGQSARLVTATGVDLGAEIAPEQIDVRDDLQTWPISEVLANPKQLLVDDLQSRFKAVPQGNWDKPPRQAAVVPIPQQGSDKPAGFLVVGINPYRFYDSAYVGFVDLLVGLISGGIASAKAYDSERQRAEELAKLDLAKTTFFSNVSHELRTPLTLMLGPLEDLLNRPTEVSAWARHGLELAHRSSVRLLKLVNTLLDFSRLEAGKVEARFEPVDLAALTVEMASNFMSACEQAGLKFIVNCPNLDEPVYVDRLMWEKVVLNLLSNALKYTFRGEIELDLFRENEQAVLTVRDTGTGIPADALPQLFERFYRVEGVTGRTHEGTGIGLSLVQELLRLHGASVSASSEFGRGSIFRVAIPFGRLHLPPDKVREVADGIGGSSIAEAYVTEANQWLREISAELPEKDDGDLMDSNESSSGGIRARIVIADDNVDLREYLARLLSPQFSLEVVSNGAEAIDAAKREIPDLIITDVMMPVMDGFEVVKAVRTDETLREIPVLMLSARAGEEAKVEGLEYGADDYLVKPFSAKELLARVLSNIELSRLRKQSVIREQGLRITAEAAFARMKEFSESLPQIVLECEPDGTTRWANDRYYEYTGAAPNSVPNDRGQSMVDSDDWELLRSRWREFSQLGLPLRTEIRIRRWDGEMRWWLVAASVIRDLEGKIDRVYLLATDIHDQKETEQELERRVEARTEELVLANREMEGFTYTVSHDLRSPLRSIIFNSAVLLEEAGDKLAPQHRDLLNRQMRSAKKLATLIDELLRLSRVSRQEMELSRVDITEVALQVLQQSGVDEDRKRDVQIQSGMIADADPRLIQFVFLNLIENALKFSPQGGAVVVGLEQREGQDVFFVKDSGIGFEANYAEKIFQPFERLVSEDQFPGTGIGLANVKRIVERHNGRVWAESSPGQGARFYFTLTRTFANLGIDSL